MKTVLHFMFYLACAYWIAIGHGFAIHDLAFNDWGTWLILAVGAGIIEVLLLLYRHRDDKYWPYAPPQVKGVQVLEPLEALRQIVALYDNFTAAQEKDGIDVKGFVNQLALGCLFSAAVDMARNAIAKAQGKGVTP